MTTAASGEGDIRSSSVPAPPPMTVNHRRPPANHHHQHCRQETHRIYLQQRRRPSSPPDDEKNSTAQHRRGGQQQSSSPAGGPTTLSAAVRLTDSATCGDVINLLRRKFHLGPLPPRPRTAVSGGPLPPPRSSAAGLTGVEDGDDDGGDALVLVGTLHDLPPDHVQFFDGEHDTTTAAAAMMAAPCLACEEEGGRVAVTTNGSTSAAPVPGGGAGGVASALGYYGTGFFFSGGGSSNNDDDAAEMERRKQYRQKMAAAEVVANIVEAIDGHSCHLIRHNCDVSINVVRTVRSDENPLSCRDEMVRHLRRRHRDAWDVFFSKMFHHGGSDAAAVVERMVGARRRQQRGGGGGRKKKPRTTFRWFFQPRFEVDRGGGGGKKVDDDDADGAMAMAMRPTAFVELDGYCTADDGGSTDDDVDDDDDEHDDVVGDHHRHLLLLSGRRRLDESSSPRHPGAREEEDGDDADSTHAEVGRGVGGKVDRLVGSDDNGRDASAHASSSSAHHPSDGTSIEVSAVDDMRHSDRRLHLHPHYNPRTTVELRRKATLQRLRSESSSGGSGQYSVGGFLLRQSRSDPNVWRRVYCVLVDDRLWYVSRMRPLVNDNSPGGGHGVLGVGRSRSCVRPYFDDDASDESADDYDDRPNIGSSSSSAGAADVADEVTPLPTQMPSKEVGGTAATTSSSAASASAADPSSSSSRCPPPSRQHVFSPPRCAMCSRRIGRYRSIRLRGARVTEPRPGSPHSTLPNGIVIREVTNNGGGGGAVVHHHFRAERGRDAQLRWIQALADRIVTLHEDGYMDLAECIISDAEGGRARRMEVEVVAPCAGMVVMPPSHHHDDTMPVPGAVGTTGTNTGTGTGTGIVPRRMGGGSRTKLWSMTGNGAEFVDLVRFGMLVQAYREKCRHHEEWCRHGGVGGIGDHGGAVGRGVSSNGGTGVTTDDGVVDGETASVKAIKLARRGRLEESIRLISTLWEEAAHVCSASDVSVSVSSSTERDAEEMEQALRRIDTLRAEITFRVQENADCGLRAYRAILTDDGRGLPPPPPIDLFDEMVRRRIELVQMAEKRYEEHGLFGHDSSML